MSDFRELGINIRRFLREFTLRGLPDRWEEELPEEFPPAGVDLVYHTLRVRLDVGKTGQGDEIVDLFGKMIVERGDPYADRDGRRTIDFVVRSWEASGWSWTLGQVLTYVLAEDVEQPTSSIVAEQEETPFPATFAFNVIFDVRANNVRVFGRQHGRPEGHGFMTIPPAGDRKLSPRITQFETNLVEVEHPQLGMIQAIPIDCNDQASITLAWR